ncbi:S-adenosyl-L-methionine-dependent methyltransferase [Mortierella sp. GBAus27b]|nr:hypothetical protein BGX31_005094 [Mortierella sp. GBA43]KAI8352350.1 S-adenosyl-L-methionine-dependent methyltransferase [Mortierella sp. GBAus27b]
MSQQGPTSSAPANGDDKWSSEKYVKNASFVPALGAPVLQLLDPQPHERILDLGAGDGVLTLDLEKRSQSVVAIDASADMIEAAKKNGCQDARVVDGYELADHELANGQFDAVFSNAALHWMKKDPARVIQGVNKSLKSGGRFVGEMGGHMNVSEVRTGLHAALKKRGVNPETYDPWFFPGTAMYTRLLEANGFRVDSIELIPRYTRLNTDIAGWIDTFGFSFLKPFEDDEQKRREIIEEVQGNLSFSQDEGVWYIMYMRLRFKATKI